MKRKLQTIALVLGVLFVVGSFVAVTLAEPYIEYSLSGFTAYNILPVNVFTIGIETTPIFTALTFDFAFVGEVLSTPIGIVFNPGARFFGQYGDPNTFIELGCIIDKVGGFSPFINLKLSIPLFSLWGVQTGL